MVRMMGLIGSVVGGYAGWFAGKAIGGNALGFILSMVGTGAGMYYAARWARNNLT
jgi:hypothetical protein